MRTNKSPIAAFLLSFIPGIGHAYLGRPVRFLVYAGGFFGPLCLLLLLGITGNFDEDLGILLLLVSGIIGLINMLDMIVSLITGSYRVEHQEHSGYMQGEAAVGAGAATREGTLSLSIEQQQERSRTILFSIIPGLGHMSLGLMQRGITLLIASVGLMAIIVFLSSIIGSAALLVFLLAIPVIWIYSMFDAMSLLHAKHRGENIADLSVFEELERHIASGTKSKVLAIALSVFPGAGHLYLGLQKRGLQLMGGFLLAIYIMDNMRLSLFFFLLPLFWCFAFFDALQQASRYERQEMTDEPILKQFVPYQRWFGIALLGFGIYYLLDRVASQYMSRFTTEIYEQYLQLKYLLPTAVVSFIMIVIGLRLVLGGKTKQTTAANTYSEQVQDEHKEDMS